MPEALLRSLKARAEGVRISLSDYLLMELREIAKRPTLAEFRERLTSRKPVHLAFDAAEILREKRSAR